MSAGQIFLLESTPWHRAPQEAAKFHQRSQRDQTKTNKDSKSFMNLSHVTPEACSGSVQMAGDERRGSSGKVSNGFGGGR